MVLAPEQRLERWRWQSAQSAWPENGLSVERPSHAAQPNQYPRKLRADRRRDQSEDGAQKEEAGLPALSSARCGTEAPCRRRHERGGQALPDRAFGGVRQVE